MRAIEKLFKRLNIQDKKIELITQHLEDMIIHLRGTMTSKDYDHNHCTLGYNDQQELNTLLKALKTDLSN